MKREKKNLKKSKYVISSPVGKLGLVILNDYLVGIDFLQSQVKLSSPRTLKLRSIVSQIKQYFFAPHLPLKVPFEVEGTILQKKIWSNIQKISCGKTVTYGELARKLGTSPRVIGNACRRNTLPIIIPCHRVVSVVNIGGYCGNNKETIEIKQWLLQHEKNIRKD